MAWTKQIANPRGRAPRLIEGAILIIVISACTSFAPPRLPPSRPDYIAWKYEVISKADLELEVEASFDSNQDSSFGVDQDANDFVSDLEQARGSSWEPIVRSSSGWNIACRAGCRVRYHFALRNAADSLADVNTAIASGNAVFSPPSTWLLHPKSPGPGARFEFHVAPAVELPFSCSDATRSW